MLRNLIVLALAMTLLSGCCITHFAIKANGDVNTGAIGGEVSFKACTPIEKELAAQIKVASDNFRSQWNACAVGDDACRDSAQKLWSTQLDKYTDLWKKLKDTPEKDQEANFRSAVDAFRVSLGAAL